nr:MAG TPA: hypothetical protein [Caudoviricetes sp.]
MPLSNFRKMFLKFCFFARLFWQADLCKTPKTGPGRAAACRSFPPAAGDRGGFAHTIKVVQHVVHMLGGYVLAVQRVRHALDKGRVHRNVMHACLAPGKRIGGIFPIHIIERTFAHHRIPHTRNEPLFPLFSR